MAKDRNNNNIKTGDKVIWYDPQPEYRDINRVWQIDGICEDMALISDGYSESEVLLSELEKI